MLPHTSTLWRTALQASHLNRHWRALTSQARLDVVFIRNMLDEAERQRFFPNPENRLQQASGPRMGLDGIEAQVRGINITDEEMLSRAGRHLARDLFIKAVGWAQEQGAKVVLLAASTKRLFGQDGAELKARFPQLIFTTGENGKALLLRQDVERAVNEAFPKLVNGRPRILVLGAYSALGHALSLQLRADGADLVCWGSKLSLLRELSERTGLAVVERFDDIGRVDIAIDCANNAESQLDFDRVLQLRRRRRKLMVIDASEAGQLDIHTLAACGETVWRQEGGNAHSPRLRYGLGPVSWRQLHQSRGRVFGCFAEAIALYQAVYRQRSTQAIRRDWFQVSPLNQLIVAQAFRELAIGPAAPCSFGEPVTDWQLQLGAADPLLPAAPEPLRFVAGRTLPAPLYRKTPWPTASSGAAKA